MLRRLLFVVTVAGCLATGGQFFNVAGTLRVPLRERRWTYGDGTRSVPATIRRTSRPCCLAMLGAPPGASEPAGVQTPPAPPEIREPTRIQTPPAPPGIGAGELAAETKALAFLAREVPRWSVENKCFSCHNNGDAARALYTAVRQGRKFDGDALAGTTDWLLSPEGWKHNGGDGVFSDKTLATLQFAAALASASEAGVANKPAALESAAGLVADCQQPDGSWKIDGPDTIGSPATWGRALCTAMAHRVLRQTDPRRFERALARSGEWLRSAPPETVLDAAAVLIGLDSAADAAAVKQRARCLALIRKGEAKGGGWGPYVQSPPEPFDTAAVLVGLSGSPASAEQAALIDRGRSYLVSSQLADGNWPETTRPAQATSYAQRLSTTGWATQALLLTGQSRKGR